MKPISVQDYLDKSGDDSICDGTKEVNEHGFCIWRTDEDSLVLLQVYGDGEYWNNWATDKARELKMNKVFFATKINPDIFKRFGYQVVGHILERSL